MSKRTQKSDAEALRALAAWMQQSTVRYVEYIAFDNPEATKSPGSPWRITLADCISFDGTGPTLADAVMDALGQVI